MLKWFPLIFPHFLPFKTEISHSHRPKYSDPLLSRLSWSTFGSNYSLLGYDAPRFAHLDLFIFFAILLCRSSVRLDGGPSVDSHFQVSPEICYQVQIRAPVGPRRDINRVIPKPLLHSLAVCLRSWSCWKVNLRPSLRSLALWTRFSFRISPWFAPFSFPSTLTSRPVPATEKLPHSMMLPPTCLSLGWYWAG